MSFLNGRTKWEGTPTELFNELQKVAERLKMDTKARLWPKAANVLTRRINEVRTNLREEGWEFIDDRDASKRILKFSRTPISRDERDDDTCDGYDGSFSKPSSSNLSKSYGNDSNDSNDGIFPFGKANPKRAEETRGEWMDLQEVEI